MENKSELKRCKEDVVDIDTLIDMLNESKKGLSIGQLIGILEMCEVPMSPVVRRLGVCCDVLYK